MQQVVIAQRRHCKAAHVEKLTCSSNGVHHISLTMNPAASQIVLDAFAQHTIHTIYQQACMHMRISSDCTEASLEHALKPVLSMTAKQMLGKLLACRLLVAQSFLRGSAGGKHSKPVELLLQQACPHAGMLSKADGIRRPALSPAAVLSAGRQVNDMRTQKLLCGDLHQGSHKTDLQMQVLSSWKFAPYTAVHICLSKQCKGYPLKPICWQPSIQVT